MARTRRNTAPSKCRLSRLSRSGAPVEKRFSCPERIVSANRELKMPPNASSPTTIQLNVRFRFQISQICAVMGECIIGALRLPSPDRADKDFVQRRIVFCNDAGAKTCRDPRQFDMRRVTEYCPFAAYSGHGQRARNCRRFRLLGLKA